MPRPPRVHLENALYYVSSRSNGATPLFRDARDYETYLRLLEEYREAFGFRLFAFVLLPDQLHLCLELTNDKTISAIMHAINSRYTKLFNGRYGHSGHLFQQRFKSTVMEKSPYLLRLTRYVHLLPSRERVVSALRAHPWGSVHAYLGEGTACGLEMGGEVAEVLEALCSEQYGWSYEQYVGAASEAEWTALDEELQRWVLGSSAFLARARSAAAEAGLEEPRAAGPAGGPSPEVVMVRPVRPSRLAHLAVTASLALGISAAVSAGLYARNVQTLRTALRAVTQALPMAPSVHGAEPQGDASAAARPAMFAMPSRLNGTAWDIQLRVSADGAFVRQDRLTFEDGKVRSRQMSAQGVTPSNYTLSAQPDSSVVWETMQTDAAGAVVCWRGEWHGQVMRGMVTRQPAGQPVETFTFLGVAASGQDAGTATSEI